MKRNRRRLPVPQFEFPFSGDSFRLMTETTLDGDRLAHERQQVEEARNLAEAAQAKLFTQRRAKRTSRLA